MPTTSSLQPWLVALGAGAALWTITAVAGGRIEPWDVSGYWTVSYPIALALSAVLAWFHPQRPWRWAVAIIFVQVPVMLAGGAGPGLLPLGMALLAVLCLPAILLARLAARWRCAGTPGRYSDRTASRRARHRTTKPRGP